MLLIKEYKHHLYSLVKVNVDELALNIIGR